MPILVLNATTLNTGHNWQFTASWMGEPPTAVGEQVDAADGCAACTTATRRPAMRHPRSARRSGHRPACPALFPPVTMQKLYDDVDVELVDGGVHDNQGIASLARPGLHASSWSATRAGRCATPSTLSGACSRSPAARTRC